MVKGKITVVKADHDVLTKLDISEGVRGDWRPSEKILHEHGQLLVVP